jgi:hypothetical protein
MNNLAKFLYVAEKEPTYVVYKTELQPTKDIFSLLEPVGFSGWEEEFESALNGENQLFFYTGVGRSGDSFENLNCLVFSESVFFLGDDIHLNSSEAILENVSCFKYQENSEGNWLPVVISENERLEIPLTKNQLESISKALEERRADFLYDFDDDDNEYLAYQPKREKSLGRFSSSDDVIFTDEWEDLEDLVLISRIWPFNLKLSEE